MADPDPNTPQVVDPERVVDLTRLLQIRGPLGVLNVLDTIVPVVNMGDVVPRTVSIQQPFFRSSDIFSNGPLTAPAAGAILADTGPLAEGVYDLLISGEFTNASALTHALTVEHRNAANAANLAVWNYLNLSRSTLALNPTYISPFAYEFALNERLRLLTNLAVPAGAAANGVIFARRRA